MDQKFYDVSDMAKICSPACNGCGKCCHAMTDTIHLDPYDINALENGLHQSFPELLNRGSIAFHEEDGLILPHLRMEDTREGEGRGRCTFLSEDGRCSIHEFRPGYCRLFPLGRNYETSTHTFQYFVVGGGCDMPGRYKVRINKWLGIPNLPRYESFVSEWHYYIRDIKEKIAGYSQDAAGQIAASENTASHDAALPDTTSQNTAGNPNESYIRQLNLFILKVFYETPFDSNRDFYEQFDLRLKEARTVL